MGEGGRGGSHHMAQWQQESGACSCVECARRLSSHARARRPKKNVLCANTQKNQGETESGFEASGLHRTSTTLKSTAKNPKYDGNELRVGALTYGRSVNVEVKAILGQRLSGLWVPHASIRHLSEHVNVRKYECMDECVNAWMSV